MSIRLINPFTPARIQLFLKSRIIGKFPGRRGKAREVFMDKPDYVATVVSPWGEATWKTRQRAESVAAITPIAYETRRRPPGANRTSLPRKQGRNDVPISSPSKSFRISVDVYQSVNAFD